MAFVDYIDCEDDGLIGIWKNDEEVEELLVQYKPSGAELVSFNGIKLEKRKKEYLITRLLLKNIMGENVTVLKEENGKPYLHNKTTRISITHADAYSAVMKHDTLECGVDMEVIKPRIKKLALKFTSEYERLYVTAGKDMLHFTIGWCIKEAIYKWFAKGNLNFIQQIMLHPYTASEVETGQVYLEFLDNGKKKILKAQYKVIDNNVLAWVAS